MREISLQVELEAHIIHWNESHDDLPTNGLALCRLCYWSFDEGLMSVGKNYEVLVSARVQTERNLPGSNEFETAPAQIFQEMTSENPFRGIDTIQSFDNL